MHRETRIANYVLAVLSTVAIIFMALPLSGPVQFVKGCIFYSFNPMAYYGSKGVSRVAAAPGRLRHLLAAEARNQELIAEMRQDVLLRNELESLRGENQRLRHALGLKMPEGRGPIWAAVMERDPLRWYHSLMVEAGEDKGVTLNAPVLARTGDSLVALGRITEVGPTTSKVLLLTDELSSAAARLSTGTWEGLLQGQGGQHLRMNYLSSEAAFASGDLVYTSATSATFPPDLLIGRIVSVNPRDPFLTFQSAEVAPAADASSSSEVIILKPSPRARRPAGAPES